MSTEATLTQLGLEEVVVASDHYNNNIARPTCVSVDRHSCKQSQAQMRPGRVACLPWWLCLQYQHDGRPQEPFCKQQIYSRSLEVRTTKFTNVPPQSNHNPINYSVNLLFYYSIPLFIYYAPGQLNEGINLPFKLKKGNQTPHFSQMRVVINDDNLMQVKLRTLSYPKNTEVNLAY